MHIVPHMTPYIYRYPTITQHDRWPLNIGHTDNRDSLLVPFYICVRLFLCFVCRVSVLNLRGAGLENSIIAISSPLDIVY